MFTTIASSYMADETRYLAITDAELIAEHPELFDTLMDLAFDTLSVQHLTIRVVENTPNSIA